MAKKVSVEDVEPLLAEYNGNLAAVARSLGVSRGTVFNRVQESTTLQKKLADARESMLDNAESALYKAVLNGESWAVCFFLKTQGKKRNYTERSEVTGADGEAQRIEFVWKDASSTDSA